jgi:transposase
MPRYKQMPMPPEQMMLFGQSVADALPIDSDVKSFKDVMECLDYSALEAKRSLEGCPSYPPKEMVEILTYAYSKGIRSSRRIEELLKVDIRFIWLSGGLKPDHNTIARFRKDNTEDLTRLFKDSVRVCAESGLVYLNVVATDGTKIAAASSKRSVHGKARLEREFAAVERILKEAEEIDSAEDKLYGSSNGNEIPENMRDAKERKARLKEIADQLKETNRTTAVESEPDARVMRTSDGTHPCYNLQASVDAESGVIVAMKLTQHEVDTGELPEMIEQVESNTGLSPDVSLADCGYCSDSTIEWIARTNHNVLMPLREQYRVKSRDDLFSSKCFLPDENRDVLICPAGRELLFKVEHCCRVSTYRQYGATDCQSCSFYHQCVPDRDRSRRININVLAPYRRAMTEKIKTDEGKRLFGLRAQSVEPVFGQIKSNTGFDRFLTWGFDGAKSETALACIAHNVKKCVTKVSFLALSRFLNKIARTVTAQICKSERIYISFAVSA